MKVYPYLFFGGKCDEAIAFYASALGAETETVMRYKDSPGALPGIAENWDDKVMHASFRVGDTTIMASDGMGPEEPQFQGISLTIEVSDEAEADKTFAALAEGGEVQMPIGKTFFARRFGVVADRFGVSWMVITDS